MAARGVGDIRKEDWDAIAVENGIDFLAVNINDSAFMEFLYTELIVSSVAQISRLRWHII